MRGWRQALVLGCAAWCAAACVVKGKCYRSDDCDAPRVCGAWGECVLECSGAGEGECADGFECVDFRCRPVQVPQIECPGEMAAIGGSFCMDRWEASKPDATADAEGTDGSRAVSRAGVLPWNAIENDAAADACAAAGKRLCTAQEWAFACAGEAGNAYCYGNAYSTSTCNGIETFGVTAYKLMPAGSFPGCANEWGVYDLTGNFWEHIEGGDGTNVRGGSYKSLDPQNDHRCEHVPTSPPCTCSLGFRCCLTPAAGDGGGQ